MTKVHVDVRTNQSLPCQPLSQQFQRLRARKCKPYPPSITRSSWGLLAFSSNCLRNTQALGAPPLAAIGDIAAGWPLSPRGIAVAVMLSNLAFSARLRCFMCVMDPACTPKHPEGLYHDFWREARREDSSKIRTDIRGRLSSVGMVVTHPSTNRTIWMWRENPLILPCSFLG